MTQAFNLSQFANNVNSSGQTSNAGLQNTSVTVTAGTGMSGGGAVALGSSVTLTNAGVTSVTAGSGISVSASTGGVTITNTSAGGGVTSIVAGNGISINASTGAVTVTNSIYTPAFNSVGSYAYTGCNSLPNKVSGTNYSAGSGSNQTQSVSWNDYNCGYIFRYTNNLSGTWRWMGNTTGDNSQTSAISVRVA